MVEILYRLPELPSHSGFTLTVAL